LSTKIGVPVKVTDAEIILPKRVHVVIDDISEEACRKIASAVNRYIKNY
jgi:ribosomal protein L18E